MAIASLEEFYMWYMRPKTTIQWLFKILFAFLYRWYPQEVQTMVPAELIALTRTWSSREGRESEYSVMPIASLEQFYMWYMRPKTTIQWLLKILYQLCNQTGMCSKSLLWSEHVNTMTAWCNEKECRGLRWNYMLQQATFRSLSIFVHLIKQVSTACFYPNPWTVPSLMVKSTEINKHHVWTM